MSNSNKTGRMPTYGAGHVCLREGVRGFRYGFSEAKRRLMWSYIAPCLGVLVCVVSYISFLSVPIQASANVVQQTTCYCAPNLSELCCVPIAPYCAALQFYFIFPFGSS